MADRYAARLAVRGFTTPAFDHTGQGASGGALLGLCASAGYTGSNAVTDDRVRALALVAPWLHDADIVADTDGGAEGIAARTAAGARTRSHVEATAEVTYVPAAGAGDPLTAMPFDLDFWGSGARFDSYDGDDHVDRGVALAAAHSEEHAS